MTRLLIVEDEEIILKALKRLLERNHYDVTTATTVQQALEAQPQSFDLVLADLRLPGDEGTAMIPAASPAPVVIMTSHASVRSAVEAMRHGAIDYIAKPFDHDELLIVIERALAQNLLQAQNKALRADMERLCALHQHIEGTALETLRDSIIAEHDSQRFLHLHGERGSGREVLARALHIFGQRNDAPFIVEELPSSLQLFNSDNSGHLQTVHNGTLVLRHPERLEHHEQQFLVETLSESAHGISKKTRRRTMGNGRIIFISQQPMDELQRTGAVLPELAMLCNHCQHHVPALRERPQDILLIARRQLSALQLRHAKGKLVLSSEAEAALLANAWPGNMTQLDSVLNRAVFVARGNTITLADLGFTEHTHAGEDMSLDEYFRYFVIRNQNNLSETEIAARLGISRKALWERRQKMGLGFFLLHCWTVCCRTVNCAYPLLYAKDVCRLKKPIQYQPK